MTMNSTRPITVGLFGCGAVSEMLYVPSLARLEQERLVHVSAVVDPNAHRTALVQRTLTRATSFSDAGALFANQSIDLAIIATPHRWHADLTVASLDRGAHVLCEKPMALSTMECDRMTAAAGRAGRLLAVGHFRRFFPSCIAIKEILDSHLLGPVQSFRFLEGEAYSWPAQSASFFNRKEAGGGVLIDAGAHTLDLLLWWLGDVLDVIYEDDAMGGVEANCRLHLRMANGAEGVIQLSRDWPLPNRYIINCEKGWVSYTCDVVDRIEWGLHGSEHGLRAQIHPLANGDKARMHELSEHQVGLQDCFTAQLRNVVAAIQGQEALRVSGQEARKSVALIERCYAGRSLLPMPWLDSLEQERAQELSRVK